VDAVTDRLYRGERMKDSINVRVHFSPGVSEALPGAPGGPFDWGRPTPGALALAEALVREVDPDPRPEVVEAFFHEVVLELPFLEPWVLWRAELKEFVARQQVTPAPAAANEEKPATPAPAPTAS
jgi:hypothetical protein